ncbi:Uncharacterised protein [Vibrio cholerae]|nr:Uncharacterised protein [Vibrio cholerae]
MCHRKTKSDRRMLCIPLDSVTFDPLLKQRLRL